MAIIWYFLMQVCGITTAFSIFKKERMFIRIWVGTVLGSLMAIWLPIPAAFLLGFSLPAHLAAAVCALLIAACFFLYEKKQRIADDSREGERRQDRPLYFLLPVFMALITVILLNHTLSEGSYGLYTGQSTYGDMCMHLGFITSIAEQQTFPPYYSILPSAKLCYPFLCDSISASLYLLGMELRWAYIFPMLFAFFQVFCGVYFLAEEICREKGAQILAFLLFFLCGGLGTMYFFEEYSFHDLFTGFYKTPTNLTEQGIRWVNVIADMLVPQRATLFGWSILFCVLYLLFRAVFRGENRWMAAAGIMGGLLPMIHTHSYFALGLMAMAWMVCDGIRSRFRWTWLKKWCLFGIPAVLLAVPQLLEWTFQSVGGNSSFFRYHLDWVNEGKENFIWFWVKNVGPVAIIAPAAFLFTSREKREVCSGSFWIFLISELFLFQPNPYDNNKILYVSYLFLCMLSADAILMLLRKIPRKAVRGTALALVLVLCTNAAVLTLAREVLSGTERYRYQLFTKDDLAAAEYIRENTEPDSLFLTADNHTNTVAVLTGRNILCGSGSYVYYHGLDYADEMRDQKAMLSSVESYEQLKDAKGIDYVFISFHERAVSNVLADYLEQTQKPVFTSGDVRIYKVEP